MQDWATYKAFRPCRKIRLRARINPPIPTRRKARQSDSYARPSARSLRRAITLYGRHPCDGRLHGRAAPVRCSWWHHPAPRIRHQSDSSVNPYRWAHRCTHDPDYHARSVCWTASRNAPLARPSLLRNEAASSSWRSYRVSGHRTARAVLSQCQRIHRKTSAWLTLAHHHHVSRVVRQLGRRSPGGIATQVWAL